MKSSRSPSKPWRATRRPNQPRWNGRSYTTFAGPLAGYRAAFAEELRPTVLVSCWPLVAPLGNFANYENGVHLVIPQRHIPTSLFNLSEDSQPRTLSTGNAAGEPHSTGKLAGAC
jgi:hypothetical protein